MTVQAKLIVCDDVRQETDGKFTLAGVYPGDMLLLNNPAKGAVIPPAFISVLPRLAFVVFFTGVPTATLAGRVRLIAPSGAVLFEAKMEKVIFHEGRPATLAVLAGSIGIPALGTYRVEFTVDDDTFNFPMVIGAKPDFAFPKRVPEETTNAPSKGVSASKKTRRKGTKVRRTKGQTEDVRGRK